MARIPALIVVCLPLIAAACGRDPEVAKREFLEKGNKLFAERKFAEASIEYRNALKEDERFGEARYKLGDTYASLGDARRAYREYIRAADLLPTNTEVQLKAATYLLMGGQFEDARTRVQKVLDREPTNVQALTIRGSALAGLKDLEGAVAQLEEAIKVEPGRGLTYANLAILKLAKGDRDAARAAFEKAVELDPRSIPALLALANFYWSSGELPSAEQTLQRALAINSKHVLANRALAVMFLSTRRVREAEQPLKVLAEVAPTPETRFGLADYYASTRRSEDAKRILQPMAEDKRTASAAKWRLAVIEYPTTPARAHTMLDEILKQEPKNSQVLLTKARWLFAEGKRADALARASEVTRNEPQSVAAHYLVGTIQAAMLDVDGAASSFKEVLRLNPNVAGAQLQLSRMELARGDASSAVQLAEAALKTAPESPVARLTAAHSLILKGDLARAEGLLKALLEQYPKAAAVHTLDGRFKLAKNDIVSARQSYERAAQIDPKSFDALRGLTMVDVRDKKIAAARARVDAAVAAEPNRADILTLAARVYITASDAAAAEKTLRRAIELTPSNLAAYSMLAHVYLAQRRLDSAKAEFDAIAAKKPKDTASRTIAAMIVHAQNNLAEAKTRYQQILDIDGNAAVAANNLAQIYADSKENLDVALRLAQMAALELPDRAEVQDTLGWIYYQQELPALAIPPLQKSVEKDPSNAMYHYHLGLALLKAGDAEQARKALEHALKLQPNFAEAAEARKTLQSIQG